VPILFEQQVEGACPKNLNWFEFVGLVREAKLWSLRLDFEAKMASSHDGACPRDLLQRLVAGTSPFVCADLYVKNKCFMVRIRLVYRPLFIRKTLPLSFHFNQTEHGSLKGKKTNCEIKG